MLGRLKLYPPFDSHLTDIYNVNISKLTTPQISINVARAASRANIAAGMTTDQLFDVAFNSAGQLSPITRQVLNIGQNGGSLLFTSYDEDVRLHHPPTFLHIPVNANDPQGPILESAGFPVGGGIPFAFALRIKVDASNTRLILANAIHRMYRLASVGYNYCPLAVCDMLPSELPTQFVDLARDMLLSPTQNPPLITDYTSSNVVIGLDCFLVLRTVRLNWQFEAYSTVLK